MENWGIYIHVPWCRRRCHYCDFYFEIGSSQKGFADRILNEYESKKISWPEHPPITLYFGGGTPSLLELDEFTKCLVELKSRTRASDWEVTVEANPEDLDASTLKKLKAAGVDRLSLGIQSFDDAVLKWLGRVHTGADAKSVLEDAQNVGFEKISIDLILGLPQEETSRLKEELSWVQKFNLSHLSAYLLTVEPKTPLLKQIENKKKKAPDSDLQASVYEALQAQAPLVGLEQYEVSSWAKPGFESLHNRIYWSQGSYMGLGPGAHSCRVMPTGEVERRANWPDLKRWWTQVHTAHETELLSAHAAFEEAVAFGLRDMKRGISVKELSALHQVSIPEALVLSLEHLKGLAWLRYCNKRWYLTPQGALFADAVAREILS